MNGHEVWTDPAGVRAELIPVANDPELDAEWYPDFPGQRPPRSYELRSGDGSVVRSDTVFPLEPWSWYDAISDRLAADGWSPPALDPAELEQCVHGLSASLCAGPGHYPSDGGW
jgi:hypothetical protein